MRRPLFVVGYPRSGTTLLRALLGSHPDLTLFNEPELIFAMRQAGFGPQSQSMQEGRVELLARLRNVGLCSQHLDGLPPHVLERFLGEPRPLSFREIYERLLPLPTGSGVWGEKSLNNVFFLYDILAVYPDALVVNIVRDPRSALLSYYNKRVRVSADAPIVPSRGTRNFFVYEALRWRLWQRMMARMEPRDASLRVRYEDLVAHPEAELRRICDALGVNFHPDMVDHQLRADDPVLRSTSAFAHRRLGDPIDSSRADSARMLPSWATHLVDRVCCTEMSRLGYSTGSYQLPIRAQLYTGLSLLRTLPRAALRLRRFTASRSPESRLIPT